MNLYECIACRTIFNDNYAISRVFIFQYSVMIMDNDSKLKYGAATCNCYY